MERLQELVGSERSLQGIAQALSLHATDVGAPVVGAMHVTCADETENECATAFQRGFVLHLLPELKFAQQSAFRIANLGGRYEWGAIRIAEQHYATDRSRADHKLLVIKVNAHVGVDRVEGEDRFGALRRYGALSPCCGGLDGLMTGRHEPYVERLREAFVSEGHDRLAVLMDEKKVERRVRGLFAAMVSARVQARKVILDIQDYTPVTETRYLVAICVTLNRPGRDTEILCGFYRADTRDGVGKASYFGLGDDPKGYEIRYVNDRLTISDEHVGNERAARDHRELILAQWRRRTEGRKNAPIVDERLERVSRDVRANKHRDHRHAKLLLAALLPIVAEVAPVPAAVLLFAKGAAGIHHAFRVHKLAREMKGSEEARKILDEIHSKIDQLDPDKAEAMIEMLTDEYGG